MFLSHSDVVFGFCNTPNSNVMHPRTTCYFRLHQNRKAYLRKETKTVKQNENTRLSYNQSADRISTNKLMFSMGVYGLSVLTGHVALSPSPPTQIQANVSGTNVNQSPFVNIGLCLFFLIPQTFCVLLRLVRHL